MSRPGAFRTAAALIVLAVTQGCGKREPAAVDVVVIGEDRFALADPSNGPLSGPQQVAVASLAQGLVRFDTRGDIVPGLAERWNVSDDGLSYIFRLGPGDWPGGGEIRARDIARLLKRQLRSASRNELKDTLGSVEDIVAMTDRVIEIRLVAPRPNLLQLLAQPEFGVVRETRGTGPFTVDKEQPDRTWRALSYHKSVVDGPDVREHVRVRSAGAAEAVRLFADGKASLVLDGTFSDLPLARRNKASAAALHFDPAIGLFGLVPMRTSGPLAKVEVRRLLSQSLDRQALVDQLDVPGLAPRTTLLQGGLEGLPPPPPPIPAAAETDDRAAALAARGRQLFGDQPDAVRVRLPPGPGADLLLRQLQKDWGRLGLKVERADVKGGADFALVDAVAPTNSPAWFVRRFRCKAVPVCLDAADKLMDSARLATVAAQRAAFLAEAARLLDEDAVFIPLAAPIRWSLVGDELPGFAENIAARHPLVGLSSRPARQGD